MVLVRSSPLFTEKRGLKGSSFVQLFNRKELKDRRRKLRKNQTSAESILWELLRNRKLSGYRFVRQYSVGPYILDFYCPRLKVAIELDGIHHSLPDQARYDKERDDNLSMFGIRILRFWNDELLNNSGKVINKIEEVLKKRNDDFYRKN